MPSGGKRAGAGRPKQKKVSTAPSKQLANEILEFISLKENPHGKREGPDQCMCICCQYWDFSRHSDMRFRQQTLEKLLNRTLGLPAKIAEESNDVTERLRNKTPDELDFIVVYRRDPASAQELATFVADRKRAQA